MAFTPKRIRHRTSRNRGNKHLPPLAIVGICLAAAVLVTVIVGNILKATLDDETYRKLTEGTTAPTEAETPDEGYGTRIQAPALQLGQDVTELSGYTAASVLLNRTDGSLYYTSPVAQYQGLTCYASVNLTEEMGTASAFLRHVSGVYHAQAFSAPSADLRDAKALEEGALLREFFRVGGKEAVLIDLPFGQTSLEDILSYVKLLRVASGANALGVAVPLSVAESTDGWEILSRLLTVCDFCLLDLRLETVNDPTANDLGVSEEALQILQRTNYFRSQYGTRLLLSQSQSELVYAVEFRMLPDYQIISAEE